jgi:SAM-dependent methyltransferase
MGELGDIQGKKVLDIGCGLGESSVYLALKGARVTAIDISEGMLRKARQLSTQHGISIQTVRCPSSRIALKDGAFDIIYAGNVLHHEDLYATVRECARLLKPGGTLASWDPLRYHPLIKIYRRLARHVHTPGEKPMGMGDLRVFRCCFSDVRFRTFWVTTLWIFVRFYLIDRYDPNKIRYWKQILTEHERLERRYMQLEKLDHWLLRVLPLARYLCWNMVVIARK